MASRTSCSTGGGGGGGLCCWHDPGGVGGAGLGGACELRRGGHAAGAAVALVDGGVLLHLLREDLVHGPHQPLEGLPPHGQQLHLHGRSYGALTVSDCSRRISASAAIVQPEGTGVGWCYGMHCDYGTAEHVSGQAHKGKGGGGGVPFRRRRHSRRPAGRGSPGPPPQRSRPPRLLPPCACCPAH